MTPRLSLVLAVGGAAVAPAGVLGAQRGWPVDVVPALSDCLSVLAQQRPESAIVVALRSDLDSTDVLRFAESVARGYLATAVSFVIGEDRVDLEERTRRPRLTDSGGTGRQILVNSIGVPVQASRLVGVRRGEAPASEIRALLEERADLLILASHANGFDLDGAGASLCRRAAVSVPEHELRVLPCFHGAPCGRTAGGNEESPIDSIGARRMIAATCWGIHLGARPYIPAATLGQSFLENTALESVLTTIRVTAFDADDLALAYFLANAGLTFGRIANDWNRFRLWRGKAADIICVGDPDSRLPSSLARCEARPATPFSGVAIDVRAGALDIEFSVPDAAPRVCLVVDEGEDAVCMGVVTEDRRAFLSLRDECPGALRITSHQPDALQHGELARKLDADCRFVDVFSTLFGAAEHSPGAEALAHCQAMARELLFRWPLADITAGSVITRSRLSGELDAVTRTFDVFSQTIVSVASDLLQRRGSLAPAAFWKPGFRLQSEVWTGSACPYCAAAVDEQLFASRTGRMARRVGCCRGCGPVHDGDARVAAWIQTPQPLTRGSRHTLSIAVSNPYTVPMSAYARLALEPYFCPTPCVTAVCGLEIEPMGNGTLDLVLEPSAELAAGTYYAGACVAIGGTVNFLRRPLQIAAH